MSPPIYPLASLQGAVFLVNSCQRYFRCGPDFKVGASLIPKLRLLFCRVPWGPLTRSSWSTRPEHLFRFAVRLLCHKFRGFSWKSALRHLLWLAPHIFAPLGLYDRGFPRSHPHGPNVKSIMRVAYYSPSSHHIHSQSGNINPVSIGCGSRHLLRPD